jgi:ATP-binding cassette subfamily F protein 3
MIDIIVSEAVKAFTAENNILNGVSFEVESGRHMGVLGRNGAGKTTLFKIISGELTCDSGLVSVRNGCSIGLISQIPVFDKNFTVEDVLRTAFDGVNAAAGELRQLERRMQSDHGKDVLTDMRGRSSFSSLWADMIRRWRFPRYATVLKSAPTCVGARSCP